MVERPPGRASEKREERGQTGMPAPESALRPPRPWIRYCISRHHFENTSMQRIRRRDKTVSGASHSFDITRVIGRIPELPAKLVDAGVETLFEVPGRCSGPEAIAKVFTRDQIAGPLHQCLQNLRGLGRESDLVSMLPQFARLRVEFEWAKGQLRCLGGPAKQWISW